MPSHDSDAALVLAARGGDKEAFASLLVRHWPRLRALCRRALGDPLLAEDAAQEAALRAMLSLNRLQQAERFGSWLGGIGLNVCRQWRQRQGRDEWSWEAMRGGVLAPEPYDGEPGPSELAEAAELAAIVRRAVSGLPPGQRRAVLLFYLHGLTYAEAAALLHIEVGTIKTRLHKARQTLRRQLWQVWKETTMASETATSLIEVRVAEVRRRPAEGIDSTWQSVVLLEEVGGGRRLPVWIGPSEAEAIVVHLAHISVPRPMTYAFMANLLQALGATVREVRITQLVEQTFYAAVLVNGPGGMATVDARPSDAINLALLSSAPIRVDAAVLDAVTSGWAIPEQAAWRERLYGEKTQGTAEIAAFIKSKIDCQTGSIQLPASPD